MRQAQATSVSLPHIVPLDLVGIPTYAWTRRTTEVVLANLGIMVDVARPTSRMDDMSKFQTTVPECFQARRLLFIEEPKREGPRRGRQHSALHERCATCCQFTYTANDHQEGLPLNGVAGALGGLEAPE